MGTMISLSGSKGGGSSNEERPVLPTDIYRMKIVEAGIEDDSFAKPNKDGSLPQKIVLTWEVSWLTEEQQEAADEAGEEWLGVRVWSRFAPYYGDVRAGGPSKFKAFIDSLREQGHLTDFDPDNFDVEDLVDIEQRVSVEKYIKTMGANAGQPGNKATAFAPVRPTKKGAKGATTAVVRPPARNVPQPIEDDSEIPF